MGPRVAGRRRRLKRGLKACPGGLDDAMAKGPKITAAQMEEVKKYRAEGEALHKAGKHQEALDTLAKAEKILGVPTN